jgi:hypothetical protein
MVGGSGFKWADQIACSSAQSLPAFGLATLVAQDARFVWLEVASTR